MRSLLIAYDLGTGGVKASLYNAAAGECLAETFSPYETFYPEPGWHEQRPEDWWTAVVLSTRRLLDKPGVDRRQIAGIGLSGHSLGVVPLDASGNLLRDKTPIWSDSRSTIQARKFFNNIDEKEWYQQTGNGFPPAHYSIFKLMWYRDKEPEMFSKIRHVVGTKDYINYRLTGRIVTDFSYASGSGTYDLINWRYAPKLLQASQLPETILPDIVPSTEIIGSLTKQSAEELGLPLSVQVVAGGVDNSCMAVGAGNIHDRSVYNNQGSSSGIAVTSKQPILDDHFRPFIFAAVIPGLFNSAVPVFSAGTSFRWVRDCFCQDIIQRAKAEGKEVYDLMTSLAATSPAGSHGLVFHPNLAGGSSIDPGVNLRGAFFGMDLGHTRADLIRATMEGIAFELRVALEKFRSKIPLTEDIIVVGGGSRSQLWRQIYADIYKMRIIKTNIDQQAAALGAAALAAVGTGMWAGFEIIDQIIKIEEITEPNPENMAIYDALMPVFTLAGRHFSNLGDMLKQRQI